MFSLRDSRSVVRESNNDETFGDIWKLISAYPNAESIFKIPPETPSNTPFKYYSDGLNNFA
jgi:hypothetical protein